MQRDAAAPSFPIPITRVSSLSFAAPELLRYELEAQRLRIESALEAGGYIAESARVKSEVDQARSEPQGANELRHIAEMPPDDQTKEQPGHRKQQVSEKFAARRIATEIEDANHAGINADKSQKCTKVDQLGRSLVVEYQATGKGQDADQQDVPGGDGGTGMDVAKNSSRQYSIPAHSIEEPRDSGLRSQTGTQTRDYQNGGHGAKQPQPSYDSGYIHERGLNIRKIVEAGMDSLSQIDLQASKDASKDTNKDGSQQDIALRILDFFRKCADSIEATIGEGGQSGTCGKATPVE